MTDAEAEAYHDLCTFQAQYNALLDLDADDPQRRRDLPVLQELLRRAREHYRDMVAIHEHSEEMRGYLPGE